MNLKLMDFLNKVVKDVDEYINENVKGEPKNLYEAGLHLIRAGGKRLRPAILIASGMVFGGNYDDLIPFAAAVELIHTFTLIHDDIMDNDDFRRGVPTVHKLWGTSMAILAGDLLFSKAFELASKRVIERMKTRALRGARALNILARATSIVAEGQAMDMMFEKMERLSEKDYLEMIYKKTAALIEASAEIGAVIGGASRSDIEKMKVYGRNVGLAFQIKDDILGIYGEESKTGKPVYSDLREGKKTIIVIRTLERGSKKLREDLKSILGKPGVNREEYKRVADMIVGEGIRTSIELDACKLIDQAIEALEELEGAINRDYIRILKEIAMYSVAREK